ncbi:MAG: NUDIX domain-containing protein [Bacteroidales bacterium]
MKTDNSKEAISRFNIRVYGIFIQGSQILVTDEFRMGQFLTKFPGGGMHFGEGTIDCLRRECREELNQEIHITEHFYTTDFFQPAFFLPQNEQLISIYYMARLEDPSAVTVSTQPFDFPKVIEGAQRFRWINLEQINVRDFTLPIDKHVANMLLEKFVIH